MGEIKRVPEIVIHQIDSGGGFTGVLPNGTDSEETLRRGRIRRYANCTDGGAFELPGDLNLLGFRMERVSWNLPGITGVDLFIKDPDGYLYLVGAMTGAAGYFSWRNGGLIIPGYPGWSFVADKAGGTTLSGDGSIMFTLGRGWGQPTFSQEGSIGRDERPPGMERA